MGRAITKVISRDCTARPFHGHQLIPTFCQSDFILSSLTAWNKGLKSREDFAFADILRRGSTWQVWKCSRMDDALSEGDKRRKRKEERSRPILEQEGKDERDRSIYAIWMIALNMSLWIVLYSNKHIRQWGWSMMKLVYYRLLHIYTLYIKTVEGFGIILKKS